MRGLEKLVRYWEDDILGIKNVKTWENIHSSNPDLYIDVFQLKSQLTQNGASQSCKHL